MDEGQALSLETQLRRALEQDEFRLHYQPKIDLETGGVTAVEALIRWQHPELGLLPPSQFIPLAEETGLIIAIGDWVLHAASAQNTAWQQDALASVRVTVNLSPHQFHQDGFARKVQKVLAENGLDPKHLGLELTGSSMMRSVGSAIETMRVLQQTGVQIWLDDFGTGYSGFSYLKDLPLDALQIDRSFLRDIATDDDDAALVRAMIGIARSLGIKVVAEGVETQAQVEFLRASGCDMAQGYLFSKPLPPAELAELLRTWPGQS